MRHSTPITEFLSIPVCEQIGNGCPVVVGQVELWQALGYAAKLRKAGGSVSVVYHGKTNQVRKLIVHRAPGPSSLVRGGHTYREQLCSGHTVWSMQRASLVCLAHVTRLPDAAGRA